MLFPGCWSRKLRSIPCLYTKKHTDTSCAGCAESEQPLPEIVVKRRRRSHRLRVPG